MARSASAAASSSSPASLCRRSIATAPRCRRRPRTSSAAVRASAEQEQPPPPPPPPQPAPPRNSGGPALAGGAAAAGVALFLAARFLTGGAGASLAALESAALPLDAALRNGHPTFVEFYAPWCEECRASVGPVSALEKRFGGSVNFVMLDVDNPLWQQEVEEYGVSGVPHFVFLDPRGKALAAAVGRVPGSVLEANVAAMAEAEEAGPGAAIELPFLAARAPASALPSASASAQGGGVGGMSTAAPRAHA